MLVTKDDILCMYNFFENSPVSNYCREVDTYHYRPELSIPLYTKQYKVTDVEQFKDPTTDIEGFTAVMKDTFVVSFAPTNSNRDWRSNFRYHKKIMPYANSQSLVRMHGEYARGWMNIRNIVHQAFTKHSTCTRTLVSGFSQGGGIAPICALDLQYTFNCPSDNLVCVIGAGPRVFNKQGMESYNRRVPNTVRIVWGNDIVTKLPPRWFGFYHVGKELHMGPPRRWWKLSVFSHDPARGIYGSVMNYMKNGLVNPDWLQISN